MQTNKNKGRQGKGASARRHLSSPVHHKQTSLWGRLLRRMPGWAWWLGGALVSALYVAFFYFVFVSPHGLRYVHYPEGYDIHGIDISHYQGDIDWAKLRERGTIDECPISFVLIKATEGATQVDEYFHYNFAQAREHGFTRGAYHFFSTQSTAADQVRFFISHVKLEKGDLPPALDVEKKPKNISEERFRASVLEWLRKAEAHYGVKPILYTNHKFKLKHLSDPVFDRYPYWIAHYYVDSVKYKGPWKFWQHTDRGRLPGIKGDVDMNIYNGSYYDLRQMTIGSQEPIGVEAYRDE